MHREQRPPASLESEQAIDDLYRYYWDVKPNPSLMKGFVHPLLATALTVSRSRYTFEEGAREAIDDHFKADGQVLLSFEHATILDPFAMAGVVHKDRALRPLEGNSVIAAKAEAYNWHPAIAWFLEHAGAFPAFRPKDGDRLKSKIKLHPDDDMVKQLISSSGDAVVEISIENMNQGLNVALFPRSERRDKGDNAPITADRVRLGVGRVACGIDHPENVLIVPGAVDYGRGLLRPSVVFGRPMAITQVVEPELIMAEVAPRMQHSRELAAELSAA
jgi:1-acyl-sn-glycerol-3-phosphate acyltransferase